MPYFFMCYEVFEVMNSFTCVCVLNNLLLIVIMTIILIFILKKVMHNSVTFKLFNTLAKTKTPIKLTYVCRLLSKKIIS
jgi:Na+(H+)/acetate symporter ActP